MKQLEIKSFEVEDWPEKAAALISDSIASILKEQRTCNVMLTGGRSAARLYKAWSAHPTFHLLAGVDFYFGDERCVPSDHLESNYGLVMRTLFDRGVPEGCRIVRMEAGRPDRDVAAIAYEQNCLELLTCCY